MCLPWSRTGKEEEGEGEEGGREGKGETEREEGEEGKGWGESGHWQGSVGVQFRLLDLTERFW